VISSLLKGIVKIDFILHCLTGLRIGGTAGGREIGGVENIVIKDPLTQEPYIPGSSLKGAMQYEINLNNTFKQTRNHLPLLCPSLSSL
jgi:CRISPR/Cas system CSM-associated protein Csm3 (group 7 of RAMP superfamily)